ncbi:MAG: glycoside hydrolase family 43 protein [Bacteroidales bacterium]|jgi:hypothetical protein|nr:glycoside hydrolase family 43 protein [Bacteroidales bacterium]
MEQKIGKQGVGYSEKLEDNQVSKPLVNHIYTADPSAHVFEGKLYIYPSHDVEAGAAFDDDGGHFQMKDYHVLLIDEVGGEVKDGGVILDIEDVPWAEKQLWDSDVASKDGKYYLCFSAKDTMGVFRLGIAVSDSPEGPFIAESKPIDNSYSIDPCIFEDDGVYYVYFGGLWGGQLQRYRDNQLIEIEAEPDDNEPELSPKVAKLSKDMLQFDEPPKDLQILDENGSPLTAGDHDRRFFEASWMHKYKGKYYFSYSTGNTHKLCYAIGDSPYGPFIYKGVIMNPVIGWTTHHSIAEFKGKWYLFYHDCVLSQGVTHLRNVKMIELEYDEDDLIKTLDAYVL